MKTLARMPRAGPEEELTMTKDHGRNSENASETAQRERERNGMKQKDEGERRRQDSDFVPAAGSNSAPIRVG